MNSRYFQNSIPSHSFNKSSNALKITPNGGDYSSTYDGRNPYDGKNSAEKPDGIIQMMPQLVRPMPVHSGVLNSWKEIATYLGRGVRTVQRWEAELQLPIHRPRGKNRSAVIAFRAELDQWLSGTPLEGDNKERTDALRVIAHEMQELALQLAATAESHTVCEKLVETAGTILQRLDVWMNGNSEPSHFDQKLS